MTPIHLTNAAVAQAALFAHHQGRLCAQNPGARVFYGDPDELGIGCAIGVALSQEEAERLQDRSSSHGYQINLMLLRDSEVITADDPATLRELQVLHDDWSKETSSLNEVYAERAEAKFLNYAMEMAQ